MKNFKKKKSVRMYTSSKVLVKLKNHIKFLQIALEKFLQIEDGDFLLKDVKYDHLT